MRIFAPAKVNLALKVMGKRDDGYHLVDSLMVPINLYDEIRFARRKKSEEGLSVTCDDPQVPEGRKNLAYKSATLLLGQRKAHYPVHIHIKKRIPVGAGLGGGSSDAAATMLGLNRFLRLGWNRASILSLASTLGADVPFFVYGRAARARGIGDQLKLLPSFPRLWMVVLYPGFPVSTRWAYQNLDLKLTKLNKNTKLKPNLQDPKVLVRTLVNDLEGVTIRCHPRIACLKERLLQEGALGALMSGSGSSVFGIFAAEKGAKKAFRRLRKEEGVRAFLVRSLT